MVLIAQYQEPSDLSTSWTFVAEEDVAMLGVERRPPPANAACRRFPSMGSLEGAQRERYRFAPALSHQASVRSKPPSVPASTTSLVAARSSQPDLVRADSMAADPPARRISPRPRLPSNPPSEQGARSPAAGRLGRSGAAVKRRAKRRERSQRHQSLPAGVQPHHLPPSNTLGRHDKELSDSDSDSGAMPQPKNSDTKPNSLGRQMGKLLRDRSTTSDHAVDPPARDRSLDKKDGRSLASKLSKSFYDLTSSERLRSWKAKLPSNPRAKDRAAGVAAGFGDAQSNGHQQASDIAWETSPLEEWRKWSGPSSQPSTMAGRHGRLDVNPYDLADHNANIVFLPPSGQHHGHHNGQGRHPGPPQGHHPNGHGQGQRRAGGQAGPSNFQQISGFVKAHLSPAALRRGGRGGERGGERERNAQRTSAHLAAFPVSDADDRLFQPKSSGVGWAASFQESPINQHQGVEMRREGSPGTLVVSQGGSVAQPFRHGPPQHFGSHAAIGGFPELDRLIAQHSSQNSDPNKIYEEINLPDWPDGPHGPHNPPPPPAPPAPRRGAAYAGSLGREGDYGPLPSLHLPPPAPITPYSGFIHNKDSEIIRPIAFKPVSGGGGSQTSVVAPRGRSLEAKASGSLSSPEPSRRHFHPSDAETYSDGSSIYGMVQRPGGWNRPGGAASDPRSALGGEGRSELGRSGEGRSALVPLGQPSPSVRRSENSSHSAYSSPGVPTRPRGIYQAAAEPLYANSAAQQPAQQTQGSMMGTGFAASSLGKPNGTSFLAKKEDYDSVPDILHQFNPANGQSPLAKPRRFPQDAVLKASPPSGGSGGDSTAATRLASYGPPTSGPEKPMGSSGTTGSHGSRHSSGVHGVTPSPSDSGVVELEAALRTKEEELGELRATMEANEAVIIRVYQEKEQRWQDKLQEWAARLQSSIQTEQQLLAQIQKLQDDKAAEGQRLAALAAEKGGLQAKLRELEQALFQAKTKACGRCGEALEKGRAEERLGVEAASSHASHSPHSPTPAEELRGEVEVLRREVGELKDSLQGQIHTYTAERQRWDDEKQKVISYQKLLQNNYVTVFERNKRLEGIIRANKLSGATSGEESESETRRELPPLPPGASPDGPSPDLPHDLHQRLHLSAA